MNIHTVVSSQLTTMSEAPGVTLNGEEQHTVDEMLAYLDSESNGLGRCVVLMSFGKQMYVWRDVIKHGPDDVSIHFWWSDNLEDPGDAECVDSAYEAIEAALSFGKF